MKTFVIISDHAQLKNVEKNFQVILSLSGYTELVLLLCYAFVVRSYCEKNEIFSEICIQRYLYWHCYMLLAISLHHSLTIFN
jgi:hypothetical protein